MKTLYKMKQDIQADIFLNYIIEEQENLILDYDFDRNKWALKNVDEHISKDFDRLAENLSGSKDRLGDFKAEGIVVLSKNYIDELLKFISKYKYFFFI